MYWIWANEPDSEDEAMIYGVPPVIEREDLNFDDGIRIERDVPFIEIIQDEDSQGILTDNLIAPGTRGLLFSSRLRNTLATAGVDNIDYYPCRISNPMDGSHTDDYMIANIIGQISCIDREASDLEMHSKFPDVIEFINLLVLDDKKIRDSLIFRLKEFTQVIVVHDKIKNACTEQSISGITFYTPQNYSL